MGAYTTLSVDQEQFELIINTIRSGYTDATGVNHRPNNCIAAALVTETNLGIRISDVVKLTLNDIVKDGSHYRLDIIEKKTKKSRTYTVNKTFYNYLNDYCIQNNIGPDARIFPLTERAVQKQVKAAVDTLNFDRVSTHSFRKFAGNDLYESSNHDIELVREFYQHASTNTTQAYLKRGKGQLEKALENHVRLI